MRHGEIRFHRVATVLLTAALLATLTVALTGGDRAGALEGPVDVVYVATGRNFPDALAGGTLAATVGAPLLTVEPDLPLPAATVAALQSLDPDRIVILGGPVAVSDAVRRALIDFARSGSVTRIEGTDRHDTAARIADALPSRTVTEHATCVGTSFLPSISGVSYGTVNTTGRFISIAYDFDVLLCQVTPPDGARLRSVTFEVQDSSASAAIESVSLSRVEIGPNGPAPSVLASRTGVTSDAATPGRVTVVQSVSGVVGSEDAYLLRVQLGSGTPPDIVAVHGARVTYEIDRVVS